MPIEDILKLKEGDHQVFKTIYEEWNRKVYFYYLKKTENDHDAKELDTAAFY